MTAIEKAAEVLGSQKALADRLHVSKAAVNQWKLPGRKVPTIHCLEIEKLTNGMVRCEDLRPDLNWVILRQRFADAALAHSFCAEQERTA